MDYIDHIIEGEMAEEAKTYKYLLFDLDGTLTDPKEGITKSVQHALLHFGIEVEDPETLVCFIGPPLISSFMEYYELTQEQAWEALQVYRERFSTVGIFENRVLDGIPQMLEELAAGDKKLVLASSKPEIYVKQILDHFGLEKYFCEVVGASFDEKLSAKPDIIREAMRRLDENHGWNGEREYVLMVGDRRHDVEGAAANEVDSLGIYTGFAEEGELEEAGATIICRSVEEMADFLKSH